MKRSLIILGLAAGLFALPSCTKDLKDDVKSLEQQLEELKKTNELLKGRAGTVEKILAANEAITATTTYKDGNGNPRTFTEIYPYKFPAAGTQYAIKMENGNYAVQILRLGMTQEEGAYVQFEYNPTTKAVTSQTVGHVWIDANRYMQIRYYSGNEAEGCIPGITIKSFDLITGDVSLEVSASASADYTQQYDNFPYSGQAYTTKFSFTGKVIFLEEG